MRRLKKMDWWWVGPALFVLVIGGVIWWHWNYKCVKEVEDTCSNTTCTSWYTANEQVYCAGWDTTYYTCTRCDQWEKR